MDILFIADPLAGFNLKKDSTHAMMREADRRAWNIYSCDTPDLVWQSGSAVQAQCAKIQLLPALEGHPWYTAAKTSSKALHEFAAVLMRKDPPFDAEYIYTTHLLGQAEREGACVINQPRALREHPEKLALMEFAQFAAPTLVSRSMAQLRAFHAEQGDVIFKPLDGMGGAGIFRIAADGMNLGSVLEQLTRNGAETIMAQRYLPAISEGDKRVLVIDGQVLPYALARIPQGNEVRGNLAAGGKGVAMPLTTREQEVASHLAPILQARGLTLVGLDMIGGYLTEINVTSPTCFVEITEQTGQDVAALMMDAVARRASNKTLA